MFDSSSLIDGRRGNYPIHNGEPAMDKHAIIVTVGTSLYHSAAWQWAKKPDFMDNAEWENYKF